MKTSVKLLMALFLVLSPSWPAQWIQLNGPYGGTILSLAVMDTVIFAGTQYCGAYYSTDYGDNWNQVEGIPNTADVGWIAVHGNTIVAVAEISESLEAGSFISTDGGKNWRRSQIFGPLVFSDSILFTGNFRTGIYRSTDFGGTWEVLNNGPKQSIVTSFAVAQRTDSVSGNRLYAATDSGLFVSINDGGNWVEVDSGISEKYIVDVAATGMNVIVSTSHSGIFFSTNGGITWSAANTRMDQCDCFAVSDSMIFAGTDSGLFESTDNGNNWTPINNGFPKLYQLIHAITIAPKNRGLTHPIIFAGIYYKGVFRSIDDGENWESVNHGIRAHSIEFVGTSPNGNGGTNLFADCLIGAGGLFISTDEGVSWSEDTTTGLSQYEITSLKKSGTNIFACTGGAGIFRSNDYGMTWSPIDSGLYYLPYTWNRETVFNSIVILGTEIYAAATGLFKSTNNGDSWFYNGRAYVQSGGTIYDCNINKLIAFDTVLFAGVDGLGMIRSSDKGKTWSMVNNGMTGKYVMDFILGGTIIFAATGDKGVFRSTDHGTTWGTINGGLTNTNVWSLAIYGTNIFAGTIGGGVFATTLNGSVWTPVNTDLTSTDIFSLAASNTDLYCATRFGGVWHRPLSEISAVRMQRDENPKNFSLEQNYPNPFNPTTSIKYSIPKETFVTLKVFSILGKEITTLVHERKGAGNYSVNFNGDNLPSGIYFYRMQAGNFVSTKKFVLLK